MHEDDRSAGGLDISDDQPAVGWRQVCDPVIRRVLEFVFDESEWVERNVRSDPGRFHGDADHALGRKKRPEGSLCVASSGAHSGIISTRRAGYPWNSLCCIFCDRQYWTMNSNVRSSRSTMCRRFRSGEGASSCQHQFELSWQSRALMATTVERRSSLEPCETRASR